MGRGYQKEQSYSLTGLSVAVTLRVRCLPIFPWKQLRVTNPKTDYKYNSKNIHFLILASQQVQQSRVLQQKARLEF